MRMWLSPSTRKLGSVRRTRLVIMKKMPPRARILSSLQTQTCAGFLPRCQHSAFQLKRAFRRRVPSFSIRNATHYGAGDATSHRINFGASWYTRTPVFIRRHLGPFKLHLEGATSGSRVVRNATLEFVLAPIFFEARIKICTFVLVKSARTPGGAQRRRGSRYNWAIKIIEIHVKYRE